MSKHDDTTREPMETDKQPDAEKTSDKPKADVIETMQDSLTLAKSDYAQSLRFTVDGSGESKLAIVGLTDSKGKDSERATAESAQEVKAPAADKEKSHSTGRVSATEPAEVTNVSYLGPDSFDWRVVPAKVQKDTLGSPAAPRSVDYGAEKARLKENRARVDDELRDTEYRRQELNRDWCTIGELQRKNARELQRSAIGQPDKVEQLEKEREQLKREEVRIEQRLEALKSERQDLIHQREHDLQLELTYSRQELKDRAAEKIKNPDERAKFEADMDAFEKRARDTEPPLSREEVAKTYEQIAKLLEKNDTAPISETNRVTLARQVLHNAADPTDVSQGYYNTCNTAAVESRTYVRRPFEAARLVADIATKGEYTTNGEPPVTVKVGRDIDKGSLEKHGESKSAHVPGENHRPYASQIFQVTAVNIHYAKENAKTDPPGQIKYEQQKPGRDEVVDGKYVTDNGERLVDYSKNGPNGKPPAEVLEKNGVTPKRSPGLSGPEIAEIAREICPPPKDGDQPGPVTIDFHPDPRIQEKQGKELNEHISKILKKEGVIEKAPLDLNDPSAIKRAREDLERKEGMDPKLKDTLRDSLDSLEKTRPYVNRDGMAYVGNEEQLNDSLARLKSEGRLPVIVGVHTGKEPFSTDGGEPGARGGAHAVTITDYDPGPPARVSIDNQWGKNADHKDLPVSELFKSMRHMDADARIAALQKEVDANRATNQIDYTKETELLYEKHKAGKITDQELVDGTLKTYVEARRAGKEGKITDEQMLEIANRTKELRRQLPGGEKGEQAQNLNKRLKTILDAEKL